MSFFPATIERTIYRGDTLKIPFQYKEGPDEQSYAGVSFTGATLAGQLRISADSDNIATDFEFTLSDQTQVATAGEGIAFLTPAKSALLTADSYAFDIEITWPNGDVQTLFKGTLNITPDVTR